MFTNKSKLNFSGGEVSANLIARIDLPISNKVLARMQNCIAKPEGPAEYRPGSRYVHHTKGNAAAVFIEFQFSDIQAYLIEATDQCFRFYRNGAIILEDSQNITGVTQADPAVLTYSGDDNFSDGDEVYISGVGGMTELNGKFFLVANVNTGANTFELTDIFGNDVDSSAYTAYTSGGTVAKVYELTTPYAEADLGELLYDQTADTMYLTHPGYAPRKLTRSGHANWQINTYTRTNDPFPGDSSISAIDNNQPDAVVTCTAAHNLSNGQRIQITGVVGMTEVNNQYYNVEVFNSTRFYPTDTETGARLDTTGYGTYTSGGTVSPDADPAAVAFTQDARTVMGGPDAKPETLYFSRSPSSAGAVRFDDYTSGTDDDHAATFTLAPLRGKVDAVRWITNTDKFLIVGTFGSVRRVYGASEAEPVTPTAISAKSANSDGVAKARPVVDGTVVMYITRSKKKLEAIEYDYTVDGYAPDDKNLISDHITKAGLKQIARQISSPTTIWALREDGVLAGLTFKAKENIAGRHRHLLGGNGFIENIGIMPQENNNDQIWMVIKRTINGNTVRYVEYLTDLPDYPDPLDFWTGEANETSDLTNFINYQNQVLRDAIHLDSCLSYDGSSYGTDASATLTVGANGETAGSTGVIFTASANVFTSDMVGRKIQGAYDSNGDGGGVVTITNYTSATQVEGTINTAFPAGNVFAAGDWYITATSVSGLDHLEGQTVTVVGDGADQGTFTVSSGAVTGLTAAGSIHVGFEFTGILYTLPFDQGGEGGPAQTRMKAISKADIQYINSSGFKIGTSPYDLESIDCTQGTNLPTTPKIHSGTKELFYEDEHEQEKRFILIIDTPLPCTILSADIFMETANE